MTLYTVIGARGFIGSRIVAHLETLGHAPYMPVRDDPALWDRDLGRIIYCAGLTGDFRERPHDAVEAHVGFVSRLLERARFERIVYLSTTRLYDSLPDGIGREDRPLSVEPGNKEHLYELSKLLGENLVLHRSQGRGAVARLSYVFGWETGDEGFLSQWLRSVDGRRVIEIASSADISRDYIHIADVVAALHALADDSATGIVNVARGEPISNGRIAELFVRHGRRVDFTQPSATARETRIDVGRLADLGISARPVLPLIDEYLSTRD